MKKIKLSSLKVSSFVTSLEEKESMTLKGGAKEQTQPRQGCPSSWCGSNPPWCEQTGRGLCETLGKGCL